MGNDEKKVEDGMKGNHGSAFIPDGLLPPHRENPTAYHRAYRMERKKRDPHFAARLKGYDYGRIDNRIGRRAKMKQGAA